MLRYFNFEPSFKLRWCHAQNLFGSEIPATTGGSLMFLTGFISFSVLLLFPLIAGPGMTRGR